MLARPYIRVVTCALPTRTCAFYGSASERVVCCNGELTVPPLCASAQASLACSLCVCAPTSPATTLTIFSAI